MSRIQGLGARRRCHPAREAGGERARGAAHTWRIVSSYALGRIAADGIQTPVRLLLDSSINNARAERNVRGDGRQVRVRDARMSRVTYRITTPQGCDEKRNIVRQSAPAQIMLSVQSSTDALKNTS